MADYIRWLMRPIVRLAAKWHLSALIDLAPYARISVLWSAQVSHRSLAIVAPALGEFADFDNQRSSNATRVTWASN